jgi:hypothetical protein
MNSAEPGLVPVPTAVADVHQLPADQERAPGAGIPCLHHAHFRSGRLGRRGGTGWGSVVSDLPRKSRVARHAVVAGVSLLATVSHHGNRLHRNLDSSSRLRFPLSYRSYFMIRLAYGSVEPATLVASLWLFGITIGVATAQPSGVLLWTALVLFTFAIVNILLARARLVTAAGKVRRRDPDRPVAGHVRVCHLRLGIESH